MRSAAWIGLFGLLGCLGRYGEPPAAISAGLGYIRSLAPTPRATLLAATETGLHEVDAAGRFVTLWPEPSRAVSGHPDRVYVLADEALHIGPWPAPDGLFTPTKRYPYPEARDLLAWREGTLLIAIADRVDLFDPRSGTAAPWARAPEPVLALALQPGDAGPAGLILTRTTLQRKRGPQLETLVEGLHDATAVGVDRFGRIWLVDGDTLYGLDEEGTLLRRAEAPAGAADLHFSEAEGALPLDQAYLASPAGQVEVVRVAPPSAPGP